MSNTYSNLTLYGINNDPERFIWGTWLVLIFISCVLGDTVILISSVRCNAFKLHKFMVVCIEHIAVSDLLVAICIFFRIGSIFENGWIFGEGFKKFAFVHFQYASGIASLLLICFMTSSKLWLIKHPLKSQFLLKATAHKFCAFLWALSVALPSTYLIDDKGSVRWDYRSYSLDFSFDPANASIIEHVMIYATVIPILVVVITSVLLIKHLLSSRRVANRARGSLRWQGIAAVVAVAGVYMAASIPLTFAYVIPGFAPNHSKYTYAVAIRTTTTLFYFNTLANFFIYFFTVKSFRSFIKKHVHRVAACMTG